MLDIDIAFSKSLHLSETDRIKTSIELQTLSHAYAKYFKHLSLPETKIFRIHFTDDSSFEDVLIKPAKALGSVCLLETFYDIKERYIDKSDVEKCNEVVRIIHEYLFKLSAVICLDTDLLSDIINGIKANHKGFEYCIFKAKKNSSKTHNAALYMQLTPSRKIYSLHITDLKRGKVNVKEFLQLNNYYIDLYTNTNTIISMLRWNGNCIELVGTKGTYERIIHSYNPETDSVSVDFNLEPDVNAKLFKQEFEMATTTNTELIDSYIKGRTNLNWKTYL